MKKLVRVLCISLSVIMVLGVVAVAAACPRNRKKVKVTYINKTRQVAEFEVDSHEKIPADKVAPDPIPDADEVFVCWSDDGSTDFIAKKEPKEDTLLESVFRERKEGEIVVTFNTDGGNNIKHIVIQKGGTIEKPADPTKANAKFDMWQAVGQSKAYDFATPINEDTVLRAFWIEGEGKILILGSGNLDGVFSPFFATSAPDSDIQGNTQISMLSADANGGVYVGEDVPSVVKEYSEKIFVNNVEDDGKKANALSPADKEKWSVCRTDYEFVIKNDIKFSDGTDLTIKDVLFNMYVYLDPVYTGSSTMYSTKIKGLNAYRSQEAGASDAGGENNDKASTNAVRRFTGMTDFFNSNASKRTTARRSMTEEAQMQAMRDVQDLRENFWRELTSDYNSCAAIENISKDYSEFGFTKPWEVFLYNCGVITATFKANGMVELNPDGTPKVDYAGSDKWLHDADSLVKIVFNNKVGILTESELGNYEEGKDGTPNVDLVFDDTGSVTGSRFSFGKYSDKEKINGDENDTLVGRFTTASTELRLTINTTTIATRWQSGQKLQTDILASETGKVLLEKKAGGNEVETIEGITVSHNGENYVLKISIVGIDPKAIWNFGFTVAPMAYYSNPTNKSGGFEGKDGYTSFNYPGVEGYDDEKAVHLGFKQFDADYFKHVINHKDVQGLPMGAGPFKASDKDGSDEPKPTTFSASNLVSFKRSEYFYSTGALMNNVRFEYLRYQVIDLPKTMETLKNGTIHFGEPSATSQNLSAAQTGNLGHNMVDNNGFGYVGVNAKYVPDLAIRKAIMYALDTRLVESYYENGLAEIIARPMSSVSWAYPDNAEFRYVYDEGSVKNTIKNLVKEAGYSDSTLVEGAWSKENPKGGTRLNLKFTFTVAGSTNDHPAFNMFSHAKTILNDCGFSITVKNDPFALSALASGGLTVWAAAWGGGIDPDMFQVYHPRSKAASILNWGYPTLLQEGSDYEKRTLLELGELIDQGRQTLDRPTRASIYEDALDKVMDLCIEYPTYQRGNLFVYNTDVIDANTLNVNYSAYSGLLATIWKVSLK